MADQTDQPPAAPCEDCARLSPRVIAGALILAGFVAYIAADFATGGRVTAVLAGILTSLRPSPGKEQTS